MNFCNAIQQLTKRSSNFKMAYDVQLESFQYVFSLIHAGVDPDIPGNGGIRCYNYLTINQRLADTFSYLMFLFLCVVPLALRKVRAAQGNVNKLNDSQEQHESQQGKKILLVALCITFGIELGYKLSTKQLIYLLNPCHIITVLQVSSEVIHIPVYRTLRE